MESGANIKNDKSYSSTALCAFIAWVRTTLLYFTLLLFNEAVSASSYPNRSEKTFAQKLSIVRSRVETCKPKMLC